MLNPRCVPPSTWADPKWQARHYEDWGRVVPMADVDVSWRKPTEEGLQCAADLAARSLDTPLQTLQRYVATYANTSESADDTPEVGRVKGKRGGVREAEGRGGAGKGAEAVEARLAALQVHSS